MHPALSTSDARPSLEVLEPRIAPATIVVTTTSDVVDDTDGVVSLREAITAANTTAAADVIRFDPAVFGPGGNATIELSNGDIEITESVSILGLGPDRVRISGDVGTPDRLFTVANATKLISVAFSGMTLTNGSVTGNGGAILSTESLTLANMAITDNSATSGTGRGGAVFVDSGDATAPLLTIKNSTFSNNSANFAGAVLFHGRHVTITNSVFFDNTSQFDIGAVSLETKLAGGKITVSGTSFLTNAATTGLAGALRVDLADPNSSLSISGSEFVGNTSETLAGAVHVLLGALDSSNAVFTNVVFSGNSSTAGSGGGLVVQGGEGDTVSILDSVVANNTAQQQGGGVFLQGGLNAKLTNVDIHHNTADNSGGGLIADDFARVKVVASRLAGNTSGATGGAISVDRVELLEVTSTQLSGNTAEFGGGIGGSGESFAISTSILQGNTASDDGGAISILSGGTLSISSSTIRGNSAADVGGGIHAATETVFITSSLIAGNTSNSGGGVYLEGVLDVRITDARVTGNHVDEPGGNGGGILATVANTLTIRNGSFTNNFAAGSGGGLFVNGNGTFLVNGTTFRGNLAGHNGGGVALNMPGLDATISNATITGNVAGVLNNIFSNDGGGLAAFNSPTNAVNLIKTRIYGNFAPDSNNRNTVGPMNGFVPVAPPNLTGTYVVNTLADSIDADPDITSLREAILAANTRFENTGKASSIIFAKTLDPVGTIVLTSTLPTIVGNVTITGTGVDRIVIDGNGNQIFTISDNAATSPGLRSVSISGMTLHGATANTSGGAIFSTESLQLTNMVFWDNEVTVAGPNEGGGAVFFESAGALTITNALFAANSADGGTPVALGGAVAAIANTRAVSIANSQFVLNESNLRGGAVYLASSGTAATQRSTISSSAFIGNLAGNAGGAVELDFLNARIALVNNAFISNAVTLGGGGAVGVDDTGGTALALVSSGNLFAFNTSDNGAAVSFLEAFGSSTSDVFARNNGSEAVYALDKTLSFARSTFVGNQQGAVSLEVAGALISRSTFAGNRASDGAGLQAEDTTSPITISRSSFLGNQEGGAIQVNNTDLSISRSRFVGNAADSSGGAVVAYFTPTKVTLSTFTANTADGRGGALLIDGDDPLTVDRSAFRANLATDEGGAIHQVLSGTNIPVKITDSSFVSNQAAAGAGLHQTVAAGQSALTEILRSLFSRNAASQNGGALVLAGPTTTKIIASGFHYNSASQNGGALMLAADSTTEIIKSIIAYNVAINNGGGIHNASGSLTFTGQPPTANSAVVGPNIFAT